MKLGWLWVFPALGGLMIAGAVAVQVARLSDQARMTLASAEVIDISGGCPTVAFRTAAGEAVEHTSSGCSSPPAFELGESARSTTTRRTPAMRTWTASSTTGSAPWCSAASVRCSP